MREIYLDPTDGLAKWRALPRPHAVTAKEVTDNCLDVAAVFAKIIVGAIIAVIIFILL